MTKQSIKFNTPYERKREKPEENSGEVIVETEGYVSTMDRVAALMEAGKRLSIARHGYDVDADKDPLSIVMAPTRRPNYDLADATRDVRAIEQRVYERAQERKNKSVEDEAKVKEMPSEAIRINGEGLKKPTATDSP